MEASSHSKMPFGLALYKQHPHWLLQLCDSTKRGSEQHHAHAGRVQCVGVTMWCWSRRCDMIRCSPRV
jgi:hypothetical protein